MLKTILHEMREKMLKEYAIALLNEHLTKVDMVLNPGSSTEYQKALVEIGEQVSRSKRAASFLFDLEQRSDEIEKEVNSTVTSKTNIQN